MPQRKAMERANADKRQGKAASTQAGEFVKEEMHSMKHNKSGPKNAKQAVAIGLSQARRAGINVPDKRGKGKK